MLVAATPAAKALRIEQAEIERGVVFAAAVAERDIQPLDSRRHLEGDKHVAVCLLVADGAMQVEVLSPKSRAAVSKEKKGEEKEPKQALHLPGALQTIQPKSPLWTAVGSSVTGGGVQRKSRAAA
jgi:hypothetical protein